MGQAIFETLRSLITQHGYWAVGGALFLENMGLPVPGETILLLASYRNVFRIRPDTIVQGERLFAQYGAVTIFFARFIFGLRVVAGPLAGVLRMPWKRFAIFNF